MTEAEAGRSFCVRISVESGPGSRRGAGWLIGRLIVGNDALIVRSSVIPWIPARSAGIDEVGEISVDWILHVDLPVVHWRRREVVRFEDSASALFGVSLELHGRKQIVEELRARGYSVTDKRRA